MRFRSENDGKRKTRPSEVAGLVYWMVRVSVFATLAWVTYSQWALRSVTP